VSAGRDLLSRFEDVENLLVSLYGQGGRSVVIGTLARLCEEYSIPLNLAYSDSSEQPDGPVDREYLDAETGP